MAGMQTLFIDEYVWVLDPGAEMLGPVDDGAKIVALTPPGCWGPIITPDFPSGHEVTRPVAIEGAGVGDSLILRIESVGIVSRATTSGTHEVDPACVSGDPFVDKTCPHCGTVNPKSVVVGTGPGSIRCAVCQTPVQSCVLSCGYTVFFNEDRSGGLTIGPDALEWARKNAARLSALPRNSTQHSANLIASADVPGVYARTRPMIGNIGTLPSCVVPACHNAGDIGPLLKDNKSRFALEDLELTKLTDAHMDCNEVEAGTILVVPVRVPGGGLYLGDVHAMQSDGEIAGHTTDVTALVTLTVRVLKGFTVPGPVLFPRPDRIPDLARPLTSREEAVAEKLAACTGTRRDGSSLPLQVIGSGRTINAAVASGMERLSSLTGMPVEEVLNRVTISGGLEIARLPGVAQVTARIPERAYPEPLWRIALSAYGQ